MSSGPRTKPGAPAPEKKAPSGPVITPQILTVAFLIIMVIGLVVFWQAVIVKFNNEKNQLNARESQLITQISTYQQKQSKLETANSINLALRGKLGDLEYLFLVDQSSVLPLFEDTLWNLLLASPLVYYGGGIIGIEEYTFKINMAMAPFTTIPGNAFLEDPDSVFLIEYFGEKNGVPTEEPLDTRPPDFLTEMTISMQDWGATFEDIKKFVTMVQTGRNQTLFTIHCIKNEGGENRGIYRTVSDWTMELSVYFMNPEASASGDTPPGMPGSRSC